MPSKHILGKSRTSHVFGTAKVGEKGQFVIPKEARDLFDIQPGDTLILLGDAERGIAIPPKGALDAIHRAVFEQKGSDKP